MGGKASATDASTPDWRPIFNARYGLIFDLSVRTDDKEYRTIPDPH